MQDFSKTGFWTSHFTINLWGMETDLKAFAKTGAHLEAMKTSAEIAKEIWTFTYDAEALPSWRKLKNFSKKEKHGGLNK